MNKIVTFMGWKSRVVIATYNVNNRPAIQLVDAETEEPIATATVNLAKEHLGDKYPASDELKPGQCYLKTWSENEGLAEVLIEAGVVTTDGTTVPVGPYGSLALLVNIVDDND